MFKNKIVKNVSWIIACRICQAILALLINMLTARYLGPYNYGIISYAASMVAFVTPLMNLGISNIIVNEIIKHPNEEGNIVGTSIGLTMISSVCCVLALAGIVSVVNRGEKETLIVCILYSLLLFSQSFEMIQYWFQAKLMSKYYAISTLIAYVIVSAYKIFLLAAGKSVYWFALSHAIDYLLIAIFLIFVYKKKQGQRLGFSFDIAKQLFKQSKHYILPGIMGVVLAQSDRIMLKIMCSNEAVGLYSAAYSIAGLTSFVFTAIIDSMRPAILENKKHCQEKYRQLMLKLFGIVIYLSIAQAIFITIFAKIIVHVMYGTEYYSSIPTVQLIIWYTLFSNLGGAKSVWILAEQKQKYLWMITISGMLLNILLNLILIPYIGINGAALATLITQIFSNFVINYFIKPLKDVNKITLQSLNIIKIFQNK